MATDDGECDGTALSPAEVIAAIKALTDHDKTALAKVARLYAPKTPYGHEDLLQEAFHRVLAGDRTWPRGVPALLLLAGVIRSIACNGEGGTSPPASLPRRVRPMLPSNGRSFSMNSSGRSMTTRRTSGVARLTGGPQGEGAAGGDRANPEGHRRCERNGGGSRKRAGARLEKDSAPQREAPA